jgi:hypothetical protein
MLFRHLTALVILLGVMLAANCSDPSQPPSYPPNASDELGALRQCSDGQRMDAISYSLKTDAPGGFTNTTVRYWDFCAVGTQWQAWYTCTQAWPPITYMRHHYGATVRGALDAVIADLWFVPTAGVDADKYRIEWVSTMAGEGYQDVQLIWNDYDPERFASSFAVLDDAQDPPVIEPYYVLGCTPREAIDKSRGARLARGPVPCAGVGVLIISPLAEPGDADLAGGQ